MNPETKRFEPETERTPDNWPRFKVGQLFTLNDVRMKIRKVTKKDIVLRPVGAENDARLERMKHEAE